MVDKVGNWSDILYGIQAGKFANALLIFSLSSFLVRLSIILCQHANEASEPEADFALHHIKYK